MLNQDGFLQKLRIEVNSGQVVQYSLMLDGKAYPLNKFIGKQIEFTFLGEIQCMNCKRPVKKTFNQGYCYPCFISLAACDLCIMKPELCHYHKGTCREPEWGLAHCMQPHVVYLANTSQVKVGITRLTQVPTRWIDQGATQAVPVFQVEKRYHAGLIEIELAKRFADKTNWRNLLKSIPEAVNLAEIKKSLHQDYMDGKLVISDIIPKDSLVLESAAASSLIIRYKFIQKKLNLLI